MGILELLSSITTVQKFNLIKGKLKVMNKPHYDHSRFCSERQRWKIPYSLHL